MTPEELSKLSPEQKQIKIAEICIPGLGGPYGYFIAPFLTGWVNGEEYEIPDYLNDLNAMHEVEKALSHQQLQKYCGHLCDMVDAGEPDPNITGLLLLTAAERANAFLLTVG